jgi:hypothetical protein
MCMWMKVAVLVVRLDRSPFGQPEALREIAGGFRYPD